MCEGAASGPDTQRRHLTHAHQIQTELISDLHLQEHGATLHIMHLAVAPAERGAGHGGPLLAAVLRRAETTRLAAYAEVKCACLLLL
jgi:GNAT superfamily N-acetyltransferase